MNTIRILAVDDEIDILESYRNILGTNPDNDLFARITDQGNTLFGEHSDQNDESIFELVTCQQGDEAVATVRNSIRDGSPFSVVFLDVRMPPGPDGVQVARQIHELDPSINIVIVTGYTDVPPQAIAEKFCTPARLFYIQKPFHWNEIHQFALALGENWKIQKELNEQFAELSAGQAEPEDGPNLVQQDIQEILSQKIRFQDELRLKTRQIEEINITLRVLLHEKERDRLKVEESVRFNINEYILPYLIKLKKTDLTEEQNTLVSTIEKNLDGIASSFSAIDAPKHLHFSPVELQVAKLIKHGHTTKEISELLNLSTLTIESYRKNIRKKMGITNQKENLRTTLLEYL